jgi:hypothetical protein
MSLRTLGIAVTAVTLSSLTFRASVADLPYLHERTSSILYGPAYQALFQDEPSVPTWIQAYNATLKGVEEPGTRDLFDGNLFERYKVCESPKCNVDFMVILFTPGGRQAWAISVLGSQPPAFFGHSDPTVQKYLVSAAEEP